MKYGLDEKDIKLIQDVLSEHNEIREALIFGSRAMGNNKKGSDIDIALKGDITYKLVTVIHMALDELTMPYFFDVVDYHTLNNHALVTHIDTEGIVIYRLNKN